MDNTEDEKFRPKPSNIEHVRLLLDAAKILMSVAFGIAALVFITSNWGRLTEMLANVSRFEGFGIKVELVNKSYVNNIVRADNVSLGYLLPQEHNILQKRANWILPILAASTILWVDDEPQGNNNEIQFLTSYMVSIRFARTTLDAISEFNDNKFDLVISDLGRDEDTPPTPLIKCPVHWFRAPGGPDRTEKNQRSNNKPEAGFQLAEHMQALDEDVRPPLIIYTAVAQPPPANPCIERITTTTFDFLMTVFDQLERKHPNVLDRFTPPWFQDARATAPPAPGSP